MTTGREGAFDDLAFAPGFVLGDGHSPAVVAYQCVRQLEGQADPVSVRRSPKVDPAAFNADLRRPVHHDVAHRLKPPFRNEVLGQDVLPMFSSCQGPPRTETQRLQYDSLSQGKSKRLPPKIRAWGEISTDVSGVSLAGSPDPRACPCPLESEAPPEVRKQPETDAPPKLSRVPRGYWKNKFFSERDAVFGNGHVNKAGEWFAVMKWPSRDVAETRAQQHMSEFAGWVEATGIVYLGPVFFPENEGQQ